MTDRRQQVTAGLRLYVATADQLADALDPAGAVLIGQTVKLIQTELANQA